MRLSNEEKALVVKTHGLSKFTHIAMIMEDPPKKTIKEIENMICRFIQAGNYRTTRELIFLPKDLGGLGIPRVREFWQGIRLGWLKRTFTSESFWLNLLKESSKTKTPPLFWEAERIEVTFKGEQNLFWQHVLKAWQKMLKTLVLMYWTRIKVGKASKRATKTSQ